MGNGSIEFSKRRNNIAIMVDILKAMKMGSMSKTRIVYSTNLNFKRADRYLDLLNRMGLVAYSSEKYDITEQGKEYLKKVNEINSIFKSL